MQAGQSGDSGHVARALGVVDAASFERKRMALHAAAQELPVALAPSLQSACPPWWLDPRSVTWPLVFTHICEHRQVLQKLSARKLANACSVVNADTTKALQRCAEALRSDVVSTDKKCHSVLLTEAVLGVIATWRPGAPGDGLTSLAPKKRLRAKTPTQETNSTVRVARNAPVTCDVCGRTVPRHMLARHKRTMVCRFGSAQARHKCQKARVKCSHCGYWYYDTQWKRHLQSQRCTEARGRSGGVVQRQPAQAGGQAAGSGYSVDID